MPATVAAAPATATVIRSELMNVAATVPPPSPSGMSHQLCQATGTRAAGGGVASSICILRSKTIEQGGWSSKGAQGDRTQGVHHGPTRRDRVNSQCRWGAYRLGSLKDQFHGSAEVRIPSRPGSGPEVDKSPN
ncbi:hypothetical protein TPA0906_07300 [Streptomyces olivaceus]|nr:hypothetical protein TPA0906_07300 [Streptomyces olivaceus]